MAHEVESMFAVGETPWHKLGVVLDAPPSASDAIRLAGLDWRVTPVPLKLADGRMAQQSPVDADDDTEYSPHQAMVRSTDNKILGIVGPDYTPLQNSEAFNFFDPFVASGECTYHTAGSLRGGRRIWVLAQVASDPLEIVRGDAVRAFVLLSSGHDGSLAVRVGFTPIRVVCANTLAMAHGDGRSQLLKVKHTANVASNLDAIRETMDMARAEFSATAEQYRNLAGREIDKRTLEAYVRTVFRRAEAPTGLALASQQGSNPDSDGGRVVPKVVNLIDGGLRGDRLLPAASTRGLNFWRAFNGVTEYVDHVRGGDADSRLNSQWFGDGANIKRRALDLAVKMAA